ncbi:MAG: thiolase family protein [Thaumarchaeota archaeon]|nr:thiolase family protein [Nitrososphaerota archaeon]
MARAAIVGAGTVRFEAGGGAPLEGLLLEASARAVSSARGLEAREIGAVMVSSNAGDGYMGAILAERIGARAGAAQRIECLCASGASAISTAWAHVASGLADVALVAGADAHDGPGRVFGWDASRGDDRRPVAWASRFATAYMREHGVRAEEMAEVAARAHHNAQANPDAYAHDAWTAGDVMASREVAPGLRLLECSRACTGAAAVIVASERAARRLCESPAWICGVGQSTLGASLSTNESMSRLASAEAAASSALRMARAEPPDIDVAEVHDAFAVCEAMAAEAVGMAPRGRGAAVICGMRATGSRALNPRGGILGSGHALGATGVAQAAEVARQLWGQAGPRQADNARAGLVHNMAAAATSSTVLVMRA